MPSDINTRSFFLRYAPTRLEAYIRLMRLDRPIGFWLLVLPTWWGLFLASFPALPEIQVFLLYTVGALLMRSAGCVCNDLTDQKFDQQVSRTQNRPLANGTLTRLQAFICLALLLSVSAFILFQFNPLTIGVGCIGVLMVIAYPWMKRFTYWPQAFLGLTFNFGILMGWTAVKSRLELAPFLLYIAAFFWTLHYDTIYAHQDKEDDLLIGVHSSALKLGASTTPFLFLCVFGFSMALTGVGLLLNLSKGYYFSVIAAGSLLSYQSIKTDFYQPETCGKTFQQSRWVGWLILAGILCQVLFFTD